MPETGITKNQIIAELSKSPHGKLSEYVPLGGKAAQAEPEFFAHLISWDHVKGAVSDAKVALPIVALTAAEFSREEEFRENALAHFVKLGPRELEKAFRFSKEVKPAGLVRTLQRLIARYLESREKHQPSWDRLALQHRKTLANLYALTHLKPAHKRVGDVLFRGINPEGSVFEDVAKLKSMSPKEAAATITERKIPFLIALGALGEKAKDKDLSLALIQRMSATELVTNTKMLKKMGVKTDPALRAAFEEGLTKIAKSRKNALKTTRAAENIFDEKLKGKLQAAQEKQLKNMSIKGDWLVLADKSGSMSAAIEASKLVAGTLAKFAEGHVYLIFFDVAPARYFDVTGKTYEDIKMLTRHVTAGGGTSIGCGLQFIMDKNLEVDGVAIVSDGGENSGPMFPEVYKRYCAKIGKGVPVYLYHLTGDPNHLAQSMKRAMIELQEFELGSSVDYYSLPNLVQTMRVYRYGLVEEIMESKLWTVDEVFKKWKKFDREEETAIA